MNSDRFATCCPRSCLWLSDDHRIPVEIQADLQVGFVSMRLRRLG
ncbi:DUF3108 domain-containing protein [Allochromatium tepidum]|nr:DUF3108 domain-containing protein [Allochromatium tepidum]